MTEVPPSPKVQPKEGVPWQYEGVAVAMKATSAPTDPVAGASAEQANWQTPETLIVPLCVQDTPWMEAVMAQVKVPGVV
jgi:hypothetical protein